MRKTNCTININLVDVGAKADSTPVVTFNSEFAASENLKKESSSIPDYMTLEWNYSLLDGSMPHMPDSMTGVGYSVFSADMTNEVRVSASRRDTQAPVFPWVLSVISQSRSGSSGSAPRAW